jgi:hypothetical protein
MNRDNRKYSIREALEIIKEKNNNLQITIPNLLEIFKRVLTAIPEEMIDVLTYRLPVHEKFFSVIHNNHLLFRVPDYTDRGRKQEYDCSIIFPSKRIPRRFFPLSERNEYVFAHFDATMISLYFNEILEFEEKEWELFKDACILAKNARKTRKWNSNVDFGSIRALKAKLENR